MKMVNIIGLLDNAINSTKTYMILMYGNIGNGKFELFF